MNTTPSTPAQPRERTPLHGAHAAAPLIVAAFAVVYVAWGGTYYGIRVAIESIPVALMAGSRFLLAGVILLTLLRLVRSADFYWGTLTEWRDAAIAGCLLIVAGNGGVTWAEHTVPSSAAALICAGVPLWMVLFDWARPNGQRPTWRVFAGIGLGFAGILILCGPQLAASGTSGFSWSYLAVLAANMCWGAGAIFSRHRHARGSALLPVARQMIVGGVVLLTISVISGEAWSFSPAQLTARSAWGFAYLLTFGSLLGFSAYVWLMKVSTPARVGTISYVNPVIAVLVGWALGGEPVGARLAVSAVLIIAAVIIVIRKGGRS